MRRTHFIDRQGGIALLEGLIAILIFSLGILAIVGMQAVAVKQVSDARYRSDAALLANQLIGQMRVSDRTPANLKTAFTTNGSAYNAWLPKVRDALPGAADYPPTVDVVAIGGAQDGTVTIKLRWLVPSEKTATSTPHQYIAVAQIK